MANPTVNDVQAVEPILTTMLVGFTQADARFVASRVFPAVMVPNDSGTYFKFTQKYWLSDTMQVRAPGGAFARGQFGVETDTYTTAQYALEYAIADEVRRNSQVPMDLETAATRWLAQKSLIHRERVFAAGYMKTSVWGTDVTGGSSFTKWSDYDGSDPVSDFLTGMSTVSNATGYKPNYAIMGDIVQRKLVNHPDILDRIKYTTTALMGNVASALASVIGVDNWLVATAIYNSANEGQDATTAAIIDDDVLLCYVSATPGIMEASAGYTFTWDGGGGAGQVYNVRDDRVHADLIQAKEQWGMKAVATNLGYFFADAVD